MNASTSAFLEGIVNASAGVIFAVDPDGRFEFVNERGLQLVGYRREEILHRPFIELVSTESQAAILADFATVLGGTSVYTHETVAVRKDGTRLWLEYSAAPLLENGRVIRVVGTAADVTSRKEIALALEASDSKLRAVLDATSDGLLVADVETRRFFLANRAICDMLGYGPDEITRLGVVDIHPPDGLARAAQVFERAARGELKVAQDIPILRRDGSVFFADISTSTMLLAGHTYLVGVFRDITESKRAKEAIEASEFKLRAVLDATTEGILLVDAQTRKTILWNRAICDMLGYSPDEIAVLGVDDIHPAESLPHVLEQFGRQYRGELRVATDMPVLRKDGSVFYADISTARMMLGERLCMLGAFHDITERKCAEEQIKASLAEKEALLREIHHRVKNNMQVVISLLNLEAGRIGDPAVVQVLRDGQRRIEVMALVHEKLHQSRDLAEVDASAYIQDLARSAFHAHEERSSRVRLTLDVEQTGLGLDAATPCGLIVNELISNALKHAFPAGRAGEIRVSLRTRDGQGYELVVADDGIGMRADYDWRGAKTLGLRLVRNLVERQLQGQFDLDTTHGTVWRIRFGG